ncbi:hypothetical protein JCM8097_000965 [Rhodosporidiobolus ruineniae]
MTISGRLAARKDQLSISFIEDVLFLSPPPHPPSPLLEAPEDLANREPQSHDPVLRGTVVLTVNAPRRAKRIKVDLLGIATRHGGDGSHSYEQGSTLEKSLEISLAGERLEKGTHTWDFSFIIPSATAVSERSVYGTVRHTVRATLHGVGSFRDLSSMPRQVWFIANPAAPGELPSGLEIDVRQAASELGPISLHISSPHLTVASLLFLGVTFEQPPEGLKVMSVQAFVRQDFAIHYSNKDVSVQHPPIQRKLLFYADSTTPLPTSTEDLLDRPNLSRGAPPPLAYEPRAFLPQPLARLPGGKEWTYARVTRIPDDDSVRPTTLAGTDTPIRVEHSLVCQVRYRFKGSKKDQVLEMSTPVTIASCCCLTSSLLLPEYRSRPHHPMSCHGAGATSRSASSTPFNRSRSGSHSSPSSGSTTPHDALTAAAGGGPIGIDDPSGSITPFHRRCLCNTSLQQLVQQEGEKLCGAAESRSRSRAGTVSGGVGASGSGSGENSRSGSRSQSRVGLNRLGSGLVAGEDDVEGGTDSDDGGRGRNPRPRKIGETYEVADEPAAAVAFASLAARDPRRTDAGSSSGISWAAQGEALRPAQAPVTMIGSGRGGAAQRMVARATA